MRESTVGLGAVTLDCGETLPHVEQRITIYGDARDDGSNVVLVTHALTGSSRVADWWPGIAGEGGLFDSHEWCVVGVNALGSCYGSSGPTSLASDGTPYGSRFPRVTVADIVRAQIAALERIGVSRVAFVAGGSLGGMQALQWALAAPERVGTAIVVGAYDHFSPMGIALNALQREALSLDPERGLRLARKIAMLSYKSEELFNHRHGRRLDRHGRAFFDVEGYLELQADRLAGRMDAQSYATLTHAMDSFDVRGVPESFNGVARRPSLVFVGIESDWLFRPQDVRDAAGRFAGLGFDSRYLQFHSAHGHDAFLAETKALRVLLAPHVAERSRC
jgi:homoserine O-acetyltransferase